MPKNFVPKQTEERAFGRLLKQGSAFVREWEPLGPWTTWRIGGPARLFAQPRRLPELISLIDILRAEAGAAARRDPYDLIPLPY